MSCINNKRVDLLHKKWGDVCIQYTRTLCEMYDWDYDAGFWVSDDVGGVFCTSDIEYSLSMHDIRLLVDTNYPYDDFKEWWNHVLSAPSVDDTSINLYSWMKGMRPYDNTKN